ncbi:vWA domain-containing protein [Alteromonas mediterranea]|uniref:vWA domain-containing protein n=1 Tax=Alteromonas mediterranea TaxID=314275 RepID=UPI00035546B6|nr:VWA domain-containing protein [Alteromonas mediterranea]AGP84988.1 TPR domain-containing protein [Alteromonas mediterranea U4]AGP89119.1 TPR domain-containing protein [Alteromonas mediterranea U7]AGP92975.1 TPR domain-containing protein [Alteromonas mediterranea U8]
MELDFLNQFHFLRPEWFAAIIPLLLLVILIRKATAKQSGWQSVIPSHLYQYMVIGKTEVGAKPPIMLLAIAWFVSVIALAGPTWERLPQPVYQLKMGHVIVIDMSLSMRATDMTPDRLTRAKYKAIDLVNAIGEGEMGLVAYAGDAFVISPLTEDAANITTLIPSLSPEIMPVPGSDPLLGIESAAALLTNAGYNSGMIYWITDGIELAQQNELQEYVASIPFTLNALTVGTAEGAPIRQQSGELLKDHTGSIVIPKLNDDAVKGVVKTSGGRFESFTSNDADIEALAAISLLDKGNSEEDEEDSNIQGDQWKEVGPYLVVLLLPLAAFAFKRGLVFLLLVGLLSPPVMQKAHALQGSDVASERQSGIENSAQPKSLSWWQKPFMNDNQEALNSYQRGKYKDAVSQFDDKLWKASSLYKSGEYERALAAFENIPGPESLYNQGNALAKLGKLEKAIEKYERALQEAPDFEDAKTNKKIIEDLLEQQAQQEKQNQQQNQQQGSDQNQNQDNQQNNGEDDQQQSGEPNNQDGEQNDNSDQQSGQNQQQNSTEQNGEQQNSDNAERSEDSEPSEPEQQEPSSQQDNADQGENAQQNSAQALDEKESSAQEAEAMQSQAGELSDAEKEELQRMESLMRRVPDDPAFLLKRKMQLEAQKRQRQRMPSNRSDW